MTWYKKAADLNYTKSIVNIGTMYDKGLGVQQSYSMAFSWYMKAAELGDETAMRYVSDMYMNGEGVEQNVTEAERWENAADKIRWSQPNAGLKWALQMMQH